MSYLCGPHFGFPEVALAAVALAAAAAAAAAFAIAALEVPHSAFMFFLVVFHRAFSFSGLHGNLCFRCSKHKGGGEKSLV